MADIPITREEKYLAYLTGDYKADIPKPITRQERYLYELCLKGMGGEVSPEEIKSAVNEYLEKNPVQPGATTEEAAQIKKNAAEINSLKEDLSTKITKFYASSQGETHLADSDNGKIMDMMIYGKSEQAVTTGAQLLGSNIVFVRNTDDVSIPINNPYEVSWTHNTNVPIRGVYLENAYPILANKQYTISFDARFSDGNSHNIRCTDTDKTCVNGRNSILIKIHEKKSTVSFYTLDKITEGLSVTISNIMLEEGSTPHDFEPYTGGIPSPNPDYPQEIKSVVNPTVKVCGKNLFDKNNCYDNKWIKDLQGNLGIINGFFTTNHIFVKKGATVAIGKTDTARRGYFNISKTKFTYTESTNTTFTAIEDCWLMVSCNKAITPIEDFQIELGSTPTAYEPYHEQTVTLPYTLNAIPVSSGGNVTIDGQQYIADYVDVERGKLVRMVGECIVDGTEKWRSEQSYMIADISNFNRVDNDNYITYILCDKYRTSANTTYDNVIFARKNGDGIVIKDTSHQSAVEDWKKYLNNNPCIVHHLLITPTETDLTTEEIAALKALATYYPTTNISVNSEQLDGYTVFNYPLSMQNGWNYVKKQLNDNRDYIYDMDVQSAEAYVNSEYAVALTELEV